MLLITFLENIIFLREIIFPMIHLTNDTINNEDIDQLIDWLKTYPRLTKGQITWDLEAKFAKWLGSKYAVFVNSGSSANLLMLYVLILMINKQGGKIVIPNLSWATDLSPTLHLGLHPILCDINLDTLSVDLNHLEEIFKKEKPDALLLVSILGFSPHIKEIRSLCTKYGVILLEDNCESMGTEYKGTKLGNFGIMSTFSTYFGHHISTIEGGFVTTNDEEIYNLLLSCRSHGWDRDLQLDEQQKLRKKYNVSDFNALYTFFYPGFNLRSTDLQAFIGLGQVDRLNDIGNARYNNFIFLQENIKNDYWKPSPLEETWTSNFCYPIIHPKREEIIKALQENEIECRPLICGSMHTQPMYKDRCPEDTYDYPNSKIVNEYGLYIPNNPSLTKEQLQFMCDIINSVTQKG